MARQRNRNRGKKGTAKNPNNNNNNNNIISDAPKTVWVPVNRGGKHPGPQRVAKQQKAKTVNMKGGSIPKAPFSVMNGNIVPIMSGKRYDNIVDCILMPECVEADTHLPINCASALIKSSRANIMELELPNENLVDTTFQSVLLNTADPKYPLWQSQAWTEGADKNIVAFTIEWPDPDHDYME